MTPTNKFTIDQSSFNSGEPLDWKYNVTFAKPPEPVGYWVLYPSNTWKTKFTMYVRPTDEQIKNTETLLGWGWEEA